MGAYLSLRLFYLFYFAIIGILIPYFPVYLKNLGLKPSEIGLVMAAWPVAKLVTPVFWSNLADRLNKRLVFTQFGAVLCLLTYIGFFFVQHFLGLLIFMFVFSFFRMGIFPILEAIAIEFSETHKKEYGRIRYWGSLGFIAASFLFGWLIDYFSIHSILWGMLAILVFLMITAFYLPTSHHPPLEKTHYNLKPFWKKAIVGFLIASVLRSTSFGTYDIFFSIWLGSHGYSSTITGFAWALAVLCEVLVMIWFPLFTQRFSLKEIMGASLGLAVLRWLILATTSWLPLILFSQTLHAFTFGAYHMAAVAYIYQHTPSHLRSTGQAVYSSISFGLGSILGFWGLGVLKEFFSFETMFLICAGIAALGLFFVRWFQEKPGLAGAQPFNGSIPN